MPGCSYNAQYFKISSTNGGNTNTCSTQVSALQSQMSQNNFETFCCKVP